MDNSQTIQINSLHYQFQEDTTPKKQTSQKKPNPSTPLTKRDFLSFDKNCPQIGTQSDTEEIVSESVLSVKENKIKTRKKKIYDFSCMKSVLSHIFNAEIVSKKDYQETSELEKICIKHILVYKFGFGQYHNTLYDEDFGDDSPLKYQSVISLSEMTSAKRKHEIQEFIVKLFIEHEIKTFRRKMISPQNREFKDLFFSTKQYFISNFKVKEIFSEQLKVVMSTFIKLMGLKNKDYDRFFGNVNLYKNNYKIKNMVKLLAKNGEIKNRFLEFLTESSKWNIFKSNRESVWSKLKYKIHRMEEEFIFDCAKDSKMFVERLKKQLSSKKFKLPMLRLDIQQNCDALGKMLK